MEKNKGPKTEATALPPEEVREREEQQSGEGQPCGGTAKAVGHPTSQAKDVFTDSQAQATE